MKKVLALVLATMIWLPMCMALAAPEYLNEDSRFPIVKEGQKVKMSIATVTTDGVADMDELWFWKWADAKLNIQFDVTTIDSSVVNEKINLMFAAGNMPDILVGAGLTTSQIVQYGQIEGQLLRLNELIEEYAPNLTALFEAHPEYKGGSTTQDGSIYTFPTLSAISNLLANSPTVLINNAWLDACNLDKPATLNGLYDTLVAFKKMFPDSIPLGGGKNYAAPDQYIWTAFGFTTDGVLEPGFRDGEVTVLAGHELYGEYLGFMNKLYKDNLISRDYYTTDQTQVRGQVAEGLVGIISDVNYGYATDWQNWSSVIPLTSQWNNQQVWQSSSTFKTGAAALSANCLYPELAVRFIDTFYDVAYGAYLWNGPVSGSEDAMGLIGGWYTTDDGKIIYAEHENGNYESGKAYLLAKVTPFNGNRPCLKPSSEDMLLLGSGGKLTEYLFDLSDPVDRYRSSKQECVAPYFVTMYPTVYFDENTISRINEIKLVLNDYVSTESAKFITGVNSLDQLGTYYADLEDLGFAEYEAYYRDAYTYYLDNLN